MIVNFSSVIVTSNRINIYYCHWQWSTGKGIILGRILVRWVGEKRRNLEFCGRGERAKWGNSLIVIYDDQVLFTAKYHTTFLSSEI